MLLQFIAQPIFPSTLLATYPVHMTPGWLQGWYRDSIKRYMTSTVLHLPTELSISSQQTVRLVRHNLALVNPCWLFPVSSFVSFMSLVLGPRRLIRTFILQILLLDPAEDVCDVWVFSIIYIYFIIYFRNTECI